ncbi:MAG: DUF5685 family protein [Clostridia bacterium]|nr:DUF5685 family protein [Clostridia bacterium]
MFGYVIADTARLSPEQLSRYRGFYCGLCRTLSREFGFASRLALNYDMTFLTLFLSSLYEPAESFSSSRCSLHPAKPRPFYETGYTVYAAAMNAALAYYNCLDDWQDDRNLLRYGEAKLLQNAVRKAEAQYPVQLHAIRENLALLSEAEKASQDEFTEQAANAFGNLMAALFVTKEDRWQNTLRSFGFSLGKFIYYLDAACDLEKDRKTGSYNPLLPLGLCSGAEFEPQLQLLIGDAAEAFERLPLVQDAEILRNILYSGVWAKFQQTFSPGKEPSDDQ